MKLDIWTDSREEQLSSDILSKEIICFQVMKTHSTQAAAMVLISTCLGRAWPSPSSALHRMQEGRPGVNPGHWREVLCTQKAALKSIPRVIYITMRLHFVLKILQCMHI